MDTCHDALYIREHLLGAKVKTTRCGDVVRTNHHKHLLGLAIDVRLEVIALLRRVGTRVTAVHDGQVVAIRSHEGLRPAVHVGNTVTDKQNVVAGHIQRFERIVTMVTKRSIGKDCGSRA